MEDNKQVLDKLISDPNTRLFVEQVGGMSDRRLDKIVFKEMALHTGEIMDFGFQFHNLDSGYLAYRFSDCLIYADNPSFPLWKAYDLSKAQPRVKVYAKNERVYMVVTKENMDYHYEFNDHTIPYLIYCSPDKWLIRGKGDVYKWMNTIDDELCIFTKVTPRLAVNVDLLVNRACNLDHFLYIKMNEA